MTGVSDGVYDQRVVKRWPKVPYLCCGVVEYERRDEIAEKRGRRDADEKAAPDVVHAGWL